MLGRVLTVSVICGGLAAAGIFAPFVFGQDPAYAIPVQILRALGVIGFIGALISLFRYTGDSAPVGDEVYSTPLVAPRTLDGDPLSAAAPLTERIEAAAEASKRYGRTLGLIYYDLDIYADIERAYGEARAEAFLDSVVASLRARLRNTDGIARQGKGRFVVCIVLLPEKAALESIRNRLSAALQAVEVDAPAEASRAFDVGLSIYPMGGYTGEDMIATARDHCEEARSERLRSEIRQRRATAAAGRASRRKADMRNDEEEAAQPGLVIGGVRR
jgi:diguanylate cyclase (GGDEF)-like protein